MPSHFPEAFQALKDAADGLILVNGAMKRAADAMLAAHDDHNDLKETVERLEHLIMGQGTEIRALTKEVRDLRDRNGGRG